MAANSNIDGDRGFVRIKCIDPYSIELEGDDVQDEQDAIAISTAEIDGWDLTSISTHRIAEIKANRNRIIETSSYFRGLLCGSFSESCLDSVSIHWNMQSFLCVLRSMFGCSVDVTSDNFILLHEAALFFGVEMLLSECWRWLNDITFSNVSLPPQLQLDALIHIWRYGLEHANDLIPQLCTTYLARNFKWAMSCNSFLDVPYQLLNSCIQHPQLTIDSEKCLCDAILLWLGANIPQAGFLDTTENGYTGMLEQIRCNLLPLWFIAGKRRCFFFAKFANESIDAILRLTRHTSVGVGNISRDGDLSYMRIRLTEYSQSVDLSGCLQIGPVLLLSLLPSTYSKEIVHRKNVKQPAASHQYLNVDLLPTLTFEAVEEVDISNCPMLDLEDALKCFCKSFPSLKTLRAANYVNFGTKKLNRLLERCPLLCDIDLTVDISPLIPAKVSIVSAGFSSIYNRHWDASLTPISGPQLSNITRLTLEGRNDVSDSDLHYIESALCVSLRYLNLNGCISVTDAGIAFVLFKCVLLHSVLACDTSFGEKSVLALCSAGPHLEDLVGPQVEKSLQSLAYKLHALHIGGCMGISEAALPELLSKTIMVKSLCLRETRLVDDALYRFQGCSLEILDVSETKVSGLALAHLVRQNPGLKCLKARGCRHLSLDSKKTKEGESSQLLELYSELGKSCQLEEIAVGWGFSFFSLETLKPAIRSLRTMVVGLGGSLGDDGLKLLPVFCPLLEALTIYFQVISDSLVMNIVQTLRQLQVLALCYCLGEISSVSFQCSMPNLRKLKLERVTASMNNADLVILAQNCPNLVDLSLLGCTLLNPESQDIISCGWPGLITIHLEFVSVCSEFYGLCIVLEQRASSLVNILMNVCNNYNKQHVYEGGTSFAAVKKKDCGEVTANGVSSLMSCHALDDILLRHTGSGIPRNFITLAASEMPMLRKISLDVCDARDDDFDIPDFPDRCFLSYVKIARCKLQRCTLDLHKLDAHRAPVHKETLLLVWDSNKLTKAVVKERL